MSPAELMKCDPATLSREALLEYLVRDAYMTGYAYRNREVWRHWDRRVCELLPDLTRRGT